MPRVIFKCPYLKGGAAQAAHLGNYVRYMATRKGAQRIAPDAAGLPATKKQREMVEQLIRDFPLSRGLFEYEDYLASPTRGNASEFITRALEDNYDSLAKKENYISYIASRPRAQRTGAHALFTGSDDPLTLSQIADEVAHHPGNVWLPIISLRREDAARLGYPLPHDRRVRCGQDRLLPLPKLGICLCQRHELPGAGYQGGSGAELRHDSVQVLRLSGGGHRPA